MKSLSIELSVADLKQVLPGFSKVIGKKTTLPVLGCVKVLRNADQTVCLQAHNLDEMVTARLSAKGTGPQAEILVPFHELAAMARCCSSGDTIEVVGATKDTKLVYPAAGTRIEKTVDYIAVTEFPAMFTVDTEPLALDESFKRAIKEAFDCSSTDENRYIINSACLDVSKKDAHYVVATNGSLLYSANSFLFDLPTPLIVPNRKFLQWQGFSEDGPWTLRFQPEDTKAKKSLLFRIDSYRWTYVAKPIEGNYPNWKQVIPAEPGATQIVLGEAGVKTILEALPLLPGNDTFYRSVTLEMTEKGLVLMARASERDSWSRIPVAATVSGPSVIIACDRTYLAKALRFGCATIAISDSLTPFLCTGKGKKMVIAPLRPDAPITVRAQPASPSPTSQSENVSAESPSPAGSTTTTETESAQPMPENTTMTAPQRGNLTSHTTTEEQASAIDEVVKQIGAVRDSLKQVLDDLTTVEKLVRKAVKEHKASDKEINRARLALRSLQAVEL